MVDIQQSPEHHTGRGGNMKLTRRQLRNLIREMYSPNFEFMGMISDIGSPMVKQLATYLIPYQDRISFEIDDRPKSGIDIRMYLDRHINNNQLLGFIGADYMGDMCSDCYMVGIASTYSGEMKGGKPVFGFMKGSVQNKLFSTGNYGPILYELCLEVISTKVPVSYMTCDKDSLEPGAYNVWSFYLNDRPDVITKQLDPERVPKEFRITPEDPTDDCGSETSEEYYQFYTQKLVHPQGPDDDPKGMYGEYIDYVKTKDPIMKGYRKNSTPFLDLISELGMIT